MIRLPKAPWIFRVWGIRHVRAMAFCYRVDRHYEIWDDCGFTGGWTGDEIAYWKAIKNGEA